MTNVLKLERCKNQTENIQRIWKENKKHPTTKKNIKWQTTETQRIQWRTNPNRERPVTTNQDNKNIQWRINQNNKHP